MNEPNRTPKDSRHIWYITYILKDLNTPIKIAKNRNKKQIYNFSKTLHSDKLQPVNLFPFCRLAAQTLIECQEHIWAVYK